MPASAHYTAATFAQETVSGTPPANAAAWQASGVRTLPVRGSIDVSSIGAEMISDERAIDRLFGEQPDVHGIDNPEFPIEYEWEPNNTVTADASTIVRTWQMQVIEHCLGGLFLGTSTTCAAAGAHTIDDVELTALGGQSPGTFLAVELSGYTRLPAACHLRRVTAVAANVCTVDQQFPVAPVDTDPIHAVAVAYIDPTELVDSNANNSTLSWLLSRGPTGGIQNWQVNGCKSQLESISLGRNEISKFMLKTFGGSHVPPNLAPAPIWPTDPVPGNAVVIGPDCQCWVEDYATAGTTLLDVSSFNITPGVKVSRDELVTSNVAGMVGTGGYTSGPETTTIELAAAFNGTALDFYADWQTGQHKAVRFCTVLPAGQNIAAHFSRCQITKVSAVESGDTLHVSITLKALEDLRDNAAASENLHRSKLSLCWY